MLSSRIFLFSLILPVCFIASHASYLKDGKSSTKKKNADTTELGKKKTSLRRKASARDIQKSNSVLNLRNSENTIVLDIHSSEDGRLGSITGSGSGSEYADAAKSAMIKIQHCTDEPQHDCRNDLSHLSFLSYNIKNVTTMNLFKVIREISGSSSDVFVLHGAMDNAHSLQIYEELNIEHQYSFYSSGIATIISKVAPTSMEVLKDMEENSSVALFYMKYRFKFAAIAVDFDNVGIEEQVIKVLAKKNELEDEGYNVIIATSNLPKHFKLSKHDSKILFKTGALTHKKSEKPDRILYSNKLVVRIDKDDSGNRGGMFIQKRKSSGNYPIRIALDTTCAVGTTFDCRDNKRRLKIGSYNVKVLLSDHSKVSHDIREQSLAMDSNIRMKKLAKIIDEINADILVLEEVQDMQALTDLMSKLTVNKNMYKAHIKHQNYWCNVAILTKVSFVEEPFSIPSIDGRSLIAKFSHYGQYIAIMGVHLISAGAKEFKAIKTKQLKEIMKTTKQLKHEGYKVIVAGDFNMTFGKIRDYNQEILDLFHTPMTGYYSENHMFTSELYGELREVAIKEYKSVKRAYDHFLVDPTLSSRVREVAIFNRKRNLRGKSYILPIGLQKYSDHYPILLTLKTKGPRTMESIIQIELLSSTYPSDINSDIESDFKSESCIEDAFSKSQDISEMIELDDSENTNVIDEVGRSVNETSDGLNEVKVVFVPVDPSSSNLLFEIKYTAKVGSSDIIPEKESSPKILHKISTPVMLDNRALKNENSSKLLFEVSNSVDESSAKNLLFEIPNPVRREEVSKLVPRVHNIPAELLFEIPTLVKGADVSGIAPKVCSSSRNDSPRELLFEIPKSEHKEVAPVSEVNSSALLFEIPNPVNRSPILTSTVNSALQSHNQKILDGNSFRSSRHLTTNYRSFAFGY